jgi:hypothetical protein
MQILVLCRKLAILMLLGLLCLFKKQFVFKAESVYSEEILQEFEAAQGNLIPHKLKDLYVKEYDKFCEWRRAKNMDNICDEKLVIRIYLQRQEIMVE